jgi:uncharacterized protein YkwD
VALTFGCSEEDPVAELVEECRQTSAEINCHLYGLVNERRWDLDLPLFAYDPVLAEVAQSHAEDMSVNNYLGTTSLDGRSYQDRILDGGYRGLAAGEVVAVSDSAERCMSYWMGESQWSDNLHSTSADEVGVGVHERRWVVDLGRL